MHRALRYVISHVVLCLLLVGIAALVAAGLPLHPVVAAPSAAPLAAPDLVIESITLNPPNPGVGQTADISVKIKNQGDAATSGVFRLYLYINPADIPPGQTTPAATFYTHGIPLPPGDTYTFTKLAHTFTQANSQLYAWVDPPWENRVAESNENNNLFPQANTGDEFEEDDVCGAAKPITVNGGEQVHNLLANPDADQDWVKFSAESGVAYVIEGTAVGADADLTLALLDDCSFPPLGGGAKIEVRAPTTDEYYVQVQHKNDTYGPNNEYRLKITANDSCANTFESNDACSLAGDLTVGQEQAHSFCKANDVDWVKFAVTAGVKYKTVTTNVGAQADTRMGLYDSCQSATSVLSGEAVEFTAPTTGFYYARIENADSNRFGAGNEYKIQVNTVGGAACVEDNFEQDDNLSQPKALTGAGQTHNVCPAGEEDWASFTATAGVTYTVETFDLASASDTVLCLFTVNGDQLACDDNGGAGNGSRLVWQAPDAGNYLISVKDDNPDIAGPDTQYSLRVFEGVCTADAQEPDNSQAAARSIPPNGSAQAHSICPAADEDWVKFNASAGQYTLETAATGAEADTILELYNSAGALLGQNDDHAPGGASQLVYDITQAGEYFVRVRLFNPEAFGAGTEYNLSIRPGAATPTPTATASPTPTTTPTATPTPQPSALRTLILVNRAHLVTLHGESEVAPLMTELATLAAHSAVQGSVVQIENNSEVNAAYTAWVADLTNVSKANAVASAIRTLIQTYLQQHDSIEYVVLVGDDRALPFRRVADRTLQFPEKTYRDSDPDHPTGAAQRANYFLSDDYYVDQAPTTVDGHEVYLPDLAIGRLIETPAQMRGLIAAFLTDPTTLADNVLMSGYDFVQDGARAMCTDWRTDLGDETRVNCDLIGEGWKASDLLALQTRSNAPFKVQSISGHAAHWGEGAPDEQTIKGEQIANSQVDLSGGLIYTPGCHAGLNLPASNSKDPLDLAEAFASRRSNYIGHTGYGWGSYNGLGWSEELFQLFTRTLLTNGQSSMGKALTEAKNDYQQLHPQLDAYDEKILQSTIFYGLPMFEVQTGSVLSGLDDPFADVGFTGRLPLPGFDDTEVLSGTVTINFQPALAKSNVFQLNETNQGDYYALAGYTDNTPGEAVQPLYYRDVSVSNRQVRAALVLSATFHTQANFDSLIATPYNKYMPSTQTAPVADSAAWSPAIPWTIQANDGRSTVVTQLGQYQAQSQTLRIFESMNLALYYSDSSDQTAPTVTLVDALYQGGVVEVKVDADDPAGVARVVVAYFPATAASGQIQTVDLTFDAAAHKWRGSFAGQPTARFFVQVVDQAGNLAKATNKGRFFAPAVQRSLPPNSSCNATSERCLFLPVLQRQ